jgi:type IV secretory pathway VirJ component
VTRGWQIALACTLLLGACEESGVAETVDHGRFDDVRLFTPQRTPSSVVLLLSDQTWSAADDSLAQRLQAEGALVAGIDTETFQQRIAAEDTDCSLPAGDLENLAHFVQAYQRLSSYRPAILAGSGTGASLAYATLAQSVTGTFAGVLAFDFCPELPPAPRICAGAGLPSETRPSNQWLQANATRPEPQVFFQPAAGRSCSSRTRMPAFFAASQAKQVPSRRSPRC